MNNVTTENIFDQKDPQAILDFVKSEKIPIDIFTIMGVGKPRQCFVPYYVVSGYKIVNGQSVDEVAIMSVKMISGGVETVYKWQKMTSPNDL